MSDPIRRDPMSARKLMVDSADYLGPLYHLPLNNTTGRVLFSNAPPALSNWSNPIQASGAVGVPSGVRAVRAKVILYPYSTAAGITELIIAFSDNNSATVSGEGTAHPVVHVTGYANSSNINMGLAVEIDIPVNSLGQFYARTIVATNVTIGSCSLAVYAVGYYMGY